MSGHSKWANIQHKKGANDKKRASIFTKIIRELTVAAKEGGTNPDGNPRLRMAIIKARAANMPKDTMKKAIDKGAGGADGANYRRKNGLNQAVHRLPKAVRPSSDGAYGWPDEARRISYRLHVLRWQSVLNDP